MLMIRTTEATINHYKAFCKLGPVESTPATKEGSRRKRNIQPLIYANINDEGLSTLDTDITRPIGAKWPHHLDLIGELASFWTTPTSRPTTHEYTGAILVELLILFELRTQHRTTSSLKRPLEIPHPLDLPQSIDTALNNFRPATHHTLTAISISQEPLALPKHALTQFNVSGRLVPPTLPEGSPSSPQFSRKKRRSSPPRLFRSSDKLHRPTLPTVSLATSGPH